VTGSWNGLTYSGDASNEIVTGTAADEDMYMAKGDDVANGGGGADYIDGGIGSDTLHGGDGDDIVFDINSFESGYSGLIGKDQIFGDDGDDELHIASPDTNDIADGGAGTDTLFLDFGGQFSGGVTAPVVFTLRATSNAYVGGIRTVAVLNMEKTWVRGGTGDDTLTGGKDNDTLLGADGNDVLKGMGGDDVIDVGRGNFQADGGGGTDIFALDASGDHAGVTVTQSASMSFGTDLGSGSALNFERLNLITGAGGDNLAGGKFDDTLNAGSGADQVTGGAGADKVIQGAGSVTAYLGFGNDTLDASNKFAGGDSGDTVFGQDGDDRVLLAGCAAGAGHSVEGGAGNDLISVNYQGDVTSHNTLNGGDGADTIGAGAGRDVIDGGDGNDVISVNADVASVRGGKGDDSVSQSAYNGGMPFAGQLYDGGQGTDSLALSSLLVAGKLDLSKADKDVVTAEGGHIIHFERFGIYYHATTLSRIVTGGLNDTVDGSTSAGILIDGGGGNDSLYGRGSGSPTLMGGAGDDVLYGYANGCESHGGDGSDRFVSFSGVQMLTGDAGADTFVWQSTSYSTVDKAGRDVITDFSTVDGDHIDLSSIDADATIAGNDAFHWAGRHFGGHAGELICSGTGGKYYVQGDVNGDGAADFAITVFSAAAPGAGDFVL
jgi:Ca2+-binding RTX toxin-like protein